MQHNNWLMKSKASFTAGK